MNIDRLNFYSDFFGKLKWKNLKCNMHNICFSSKNTIYTLQMMQLYFDGFIKNQIRAKNRKV